MSGFKFSSFMGWFSSTDSSRNSNTPKKDSVYIQDINGKLWITEEWDGSVEPNAIAVIAKEAKFLIALDRTHMSLSDSSPFKGYITGARYSEDALSDYDGAGNTAKILKVQPSTSYAVGYCNTYVFPDGKTKGYLPSLGQLYFAYQSKDKIEAALSKCGGTAMGQSYFWSSTFWGVGSEYYSCWRLNWNDGSVYNYDLRNNGCVRPFADLK